MKKRMACKFQKLCPVSTDVCSQIRRASDCKCYQAVMRTFQTLIHEEPKNVAFDAALRVYRYHYPKDNKAAANLTVERWLAAGHVQ